MLRHRPRLTYKGLTIVLSNPSRFDEKRLLAAGGGRLIDELIQPDFNREQCDIRVKEDLSSLLPDTKCVLLLGENATKIWLANHQNTIGEIRGSIYEYDGRFTGQRGIKVPIIATFFPQDAVDRKNYELEFNAQEDSTEFGTDSQESEDDTGDSKRRHGVTARRNYRFWIDTDIRKCKRIIRDGIPKRAFEPQHVIYPKAEELIRILTETKNQLLFLDLETYYPSCDIKCVGFSFGLGENPTYVFPWFDNNKQWGYSNLPSIVRALSVAFRDNTLIAHNGAHFDFLVFMWKYRIPIYRVQDTMVMMHRCFSDVEKSLGHFISKFTYEKFHKDMGDVGYFTREDMYKTMEYCAHDVSGMQLGYIGMMDYAKTIPNLLSSFDRANSAIRPYLITSIQGIRIKQEERAKILQHNDKMMMQINRMIEILVGRDNLEKIRGKGKSTISTSNKQCVTYFHEMLGYEVIGKGKIRKDGTQGASLGKANIYKLRLKHDNPVIDCIMAYRHLQKESSDLGFIPWIDTETPKQPSLL